MSDPLKRPKGGPPPEKDSPGVYEQQLMSMHEKIRRPETYGSKTLGTGESSLEELIGNIQQGLSFETLTTFAQNSGLPMEILAEAIRIPSRTLARRRGAQRLNQVESERLLRLARIFEQTTDLFGGKREAAQRWLMTPNRALNNETPWAYLGTEIGAREVENLIGRLEHGVFA